MNAREAGRTVSTATIIAVGVNIDGTREVLGVAAGPSEAETFWKSCLRSLADRGLRGVKLVIADDHKGLRAAASKVFQTSLQRCRVRWMRNAVAHVAAKQRPAVMAAIKTIFAQEPAAEAHAQWKTVADALRERAPTLAELMDEAREDVLAYAAFPKEHWPQIASTNPGQPHIGGAARLRHHPGPEHQRRRANRQGRQEHRPPSQARRVPLDQLMMP